MVMANKWSGDRGTEKKGNVSSHAFLRINSGCNARCNADISALSKLDFNPLPPALKTILGVAQTYWPLNYKGNLTETDNKIPNL